ncbi:ATP-binding protein [Streptomyces sp. NPDC004111]|uniref:ATP-binding protein n=1 Tax=Streptomyces sp. NPDC004111 TaxID=3364690 RepID=UPI0036BB7422
MWTSTSGAHAPAAAQGRHVGRLVGRAEEVAALRGLLAGQRLVTVAGPAGAGKSRLAATVVATMPDRPWQHVVQARWQGSGPAAPNALTSAVARALTGIGTPPSTHIGHVLRHLPTAPTLLVLDDVDPVHTECMGLVQHLLMAAPRLRVLVTSRRVLGLGDEHVLRPAPLAVEAPNGRRRRAPAVDLFLSRARMAADLRVKDSELRWVELICRLVEGNPLAIELAAEHTRHYSVRRLAELLGDNQGWPTSPHRVLRRHRSLRESIGASYTLCEQNLRIVWGRSSVFIGSFTEATAVFMCAGGRVRAEEVPGCLAQLVALGVLEAVHDPGGPGQPRYRMARLARDFGMERLREAGELTTTYERRLIHYRNLAVAAGHLWDNGCQSQAALLVQDEREDLSATIRYALGDPDHAEAALRTVTSLWFWWAVHGRAEEGLGHLRQLLDGRLPDGPGTAPALLLAAWLTAGSDPQYARTLLGRAWACAVLAADSATLGRISHVHGVLALHQHDHRAAAAHFQEAADTIPYHATGGPSPAVSQAAAALAQASFAPGLARVSARRALTHPGSHTDDWACVTARYARAFVDHHDRHSARAWRRAQRTLATLDDRLPTPHGYIALRQLISDIESGGPAAPSLPCGPPPRIPAPAKAPDRGAEPAAEAAETAEATAEPTADPVADPAADSAARSGRIAGP